MSKYKNSKTEEIDEFDTLEEASAMVKEYALAYGPDWVINIRIGKNNSKQ